MPLPKSVHYCKYPYLYLYLGLNANRRDSFVVNFCKLDMNPIIMPLGTLNSTVNMVFEFWL